MGGNDTEICRIHSVGVNFKLHVINWYSGATFSKLPRKILGRFLILGQSLTINGKTLTRHNFALLTNLRFNVT